MHIDEFEQIPATGRQLFYHTDRLQHDSVARVHLQQPILAFAVTCILMSQINRLNIERSVQRMTVLHPEHIAADQYTNTAK